MLNRILRYYSLETAVLGKTTGVKHELILYTGVAGGTVGRWLFDLASGGPAQISGLLLGLIASVLIFPVVFHNAGLDRAKASFVKWCVAFQNGFFWSVILAGVTKSFAH